MSYAVSINNNPTLADILKQLIQTKGITITELARRINLPQPTIQRIASGTYKRPHNKTLRPIAEFFKITIDQLAGLEPIHWLRNNSSIRQIPLLTHNQASSWPLHKEKNYDSHIIADIEVSEDTYAMEMPDASMEPLIPKKSILIIDPNKEPHYRSFVVVKLKNTPHIIIRQLLIDCNLHYIKPLSPDFEHFIMTSLTSEDKIAGVVVQVRLNYLD